MQRQMKLGFSVSPNGSHKGGWRHPDAWQGGGTDIEQLKQVVQAAERGKIHFMFWADSGTLRSVASTVDALSYAGRIEVLEPLVQIAALSQWTQHLGFIVTASTTYNEPYNLARRFASLDHISKGRVGWNVVSSQSELEAKNFGLDKLFDHEVRYRRAEEFFDVVTGLWDSWDDDAFVRDKDSGRYFDPEKMHVLDHKGQYFSVRGPLNVPRSPQAYPVIAQAGASEPGRELAARTANIIYTAQHDLGLAQNFYSDVKGRMAKYARSPEQLLVMPGIMPIIGRTDAEAKERYEYFQNLTHPTVGLSSAGKFFGDLSKYPLDAPVPEVSLETNAGQSNRQMWIDRVRRENMNVGQLLKAFATTSVHRAIYGSPRTVTDLMEEWFTQDACDGFAVQVPTMPGGIAEFVDLVVPELQRRGLFQTDYAGNTLRENLGLDRPVSRYAQERT
ncbi:MAG TPA: LLM class flavin-dependent oxidoreductase [Beijerinckiaceae bacterium]|nr:LLM class flavin-dependent oxidoreductase [Beijerinckiaceae bacterium]